MTSSSLKEELAQLAANATIEKLESYDFRETLATDLQKVWDETVKKALYAQAHAGYKKYEWEYASDCGATRDEFESMLPKEVADFKPFVWRKQDSNVYEITFRWGDECEKIIKTYETTQQKERKRKRAEERKAQAAAAAAASAARQAEWNAAHEAAEAREEAEEKEAAAKARDTPHPHFGISDGWNCAGLYIVFHPNGDEGHKATARCLKDNGKGKLTIDFGGEQLDIRHEHLCGLANLGGLYVRFEHCNRQIVAKIPSDTGMTNPKVVWCEGAAECTMTPRRERLEVHPDQAKASREDEATRTMAGY